MLVIQPTQKSYEHFIRLNNRMVVKSVVKYIPTVVIDNLDIEAFLSRVMRQAKNNNAFIKPFESWHGEKLTESDIDALAQYILVSAGNVSLEPEITETFKHITPQGKIETWNVPVEQVVVNWSKQDKLQCEVFYPNDDSDIAGYWDIK